MTLEEIKSFIVTVLEDTNTLGYHDGLKKDLFLAGTSNLPFEDLSMDSLAAMEICISLELELGVSLLPEQLFGMKSVTELANFVHVELMQ